MFANRVLVLCGVLALACAPTWAGDKPVEQAPAPRVVPKKYTIQFQRATWDEVLDWYAKESGLTLITTVKLTGTLSLNGKDRKYTTGEVTDLINEALMQQKFILIRRHLTFFIHPTDEKIDGLSPRVALAELPERGRTEIVQVVIPVENRAVDDELVSELKKLLTPFGTMVPLTKQNAILVQDIAGNILRIKRALDALAAPIIPPGYDSRRPISIKLSRSPSGIGR